MLDGYPTRRRILVVTLVALPLARDLKGMITVWPTRRANIHALEATDPRANSAIRDETRGRSRSGRRKSVALPSDQSKALLVDVAGDLVRPQPFRALSLTEKRDVRIWRVGCPSDARKESNTSP